MGGVVCNMCCGVYIIHGLCAEVLEARFARPEIEM